MEKSLSQNSYNKCQAFNGKSVLVFCFIREKKFEMREVQFQRKYFWAVEVISRVEMRFWLVVAAEFDWSQGLAVSDQFLLTQQSLGALTDWEF